MLSIVFSFVLGMMASDLWEISKLKKKYPDIKLDEKQKKLIKNFVIALLAFIYMLWRGL